MLKKIGFITLGLFAVACQNNTESEATSKRNSPLYECIDNASSGMFYAYLDNLPTNGHHVPNVIDSGIVHGYRGLFKKSGVIGGVVYYRDANNENKILTVDMNKKEIVVSITLENEDNSKEIFTQKVLYSACKLKTSGFEIEPSL